MDEFVTKLGPHLGENIPKSQLTQLFMKIDADCGGTVSWSATHTVLSWLIL